jgi:hypothetical protein
MLVNWNFFFTNLLDLRYLPYITNKKWFLPKKHQSKENTFQFLGGLSKLVGVKLFPHLPILIDFEKKNWWISWLWILVGIPTTWFQVHGRNLKVKYQFLISLEAFKVSRLEFVSTGKPKTPLCLGPYCTLGTPRW